MHMAVFQIIPSSFPIPVRSQGNELVLSFGSICSMYSNFLNGVQFCPKITSHFLNLYLGCEKKTC